MRAVDVIKVLVRGNVCGYVRVRDKESVVCVCMPAMRFALDSVIIHLPTTKPIQLQ